jgi:hypothetical protein
MVEASPPLGKSSVTSAAAHACAKEELLSTDVNPAISLAEKILALVKLGLDWAIVRVPSSLEVTVQKPSEILDPCRSLAWTSTANVAML